MAIVSINTMSKTLNSRVWETCDVPRSKS